MSAASTTSAAAACTDVCSPRSDRDPSDSEILYGLRSASQEAWGNAHDQSIRQSVREERRDHTSAALDEQRSDTYPTQRPKRIDRIEAVRARPDDKHGHALLPELLATALGRGVGSDDGRRRVVVEHARAPRDLQRRVEHDADR